VVKENARRDDATCATHDVCDANMLMEDAYKTLTGRSMDVTDADAARIVNDAWRLAKLRGFSLRPVRTRRGADRRYRSVINSYKRAFAGGGAFGFDVPTLRLNDEASYLEIRALASIIDHLPE